MAFHIPTVTEDDLRAFHAKHFPAAPLPQQVLQGGELAGEDQQEYDQEEDDGLGYHEDGVKRTLTDEQIALFRHTEIHSILRERRRRKENGLPLEPDTSEIQAMESSRHATLDSTPGTRATGALNEHDMSTAQLKASQPKGFWEPKASGSLKRKNAKNRRNNRQRRAKKRKLKREGHEGSVASGMTDEEEEEGEASDEWDPWHQANGPDAQKDDPVDLDY